MIKRDGVAIDFQDTKTGVTLTVIPAEETASGKNEYGVFYTKNFKPVAKNSYTDLEDALTVFHKTGSELSDKEFDTLIKYDNYKSEDSARHFDVFDGRNKKVRGRRFDVFDDRKGKNNPHDHNDNFYFDEVSANEEYVVLDQDGKVLSFTNNNEVDFLDTVDDIDGGYKKAYKFDTVEDAETTINNLGFDEPYEIVPVAQAFAFVEGSSKTLETSSVKTSLLNKLWNIK